MKEKIVFQLGTFELILLIVLLLFGGVLLGGKLFGDFKYGHLQALVLLLAVGPLLMRARRKMVKKK